ncbi:hypothetical protein [Xanthomonas sp. SS]|uniref:hypothetical protein n=1 Tax=Xanthomonas sp. SS TaxID=2724122 RepID=UPI00163AD22B|nr:hypothetical protein [Xanthomonas sp. SS]
MSAFTPADRSNARAASDVAATPAPTTAAESSRLSIEHLCIDGLELAPQQRLALQDSLQQELARLLDAYPLMLGAGTSRRLDAPPLPTNALSGGSALGIGIARSLFDALRRHGGSHAADGQGHR